VTDKIRTVLESTVRGEIRENELLCRHTSLKVGGPADWFVTPADLEDLKAVLAICRGKAIPWLVIGGGYNMLVRDGGIRGVVISLKAMKAMVRLPGDRCRTEVGATNQQLVKMLESEGLSGLEMLCGIPGTIGGALAMNAGCHGQAVMEKTESITTLLEGELREKGPKELEYGYRYLRLGEGEVIVGATFQLTSDDPVTIAGRVREYLEKRRTSQQVGYPNAGSFFKNPEGASAWQLVDAAGLRGVSIGGAQVSEAHSNFIINRGSATARDIIALAALVKERVKEVSGVSLEEEVKIVGEDGQL
jgi:UDP-N-acetylmuramate dehydrogenase